MKESNNNNGLYGGSHCFSRGKKSSNNNPVPRYTTQQQHQQQSLQIQLKLEPEMGKKNRDYLGVVVGDLISDDECSVAADSWSIKSEYGSTLNNDQRQTNATDALSAGSFPAPSSDYRSLSLSCHSIFWRKPLFYKGKGGFKFLMEYMILTLWVYGVWVCFGV